MGYRRFFIVNRNLFTGYGLSSLNGIFDSDGTGKKNSTGYYG
jgi:hypothetical protein